MLVFASILALQVLIVALGVWLGYKRGIGRGIVRLIELSLIAIVSLSLGRNIAAKIADTAFAMLLPLLGEDISAMISASESMRGLIVGFIGALLVPILFAIFFSVLGLITQILLKLRSKALTKLILGHEEDTSKAPSRYIGMAVGAVSAVLVALVLFSPLYTALSLVGGLSDESVALIGTLLEAPEADENTPVDPDAALAVRVSLLKPKGLNLVSLINEVRAVSTVTAPLSLNLATATTPEGERYNAVKEAVALTNAVGAAATAITEENNKTTEAGATDTPVSPLNTLTAAATAALPHIAGQPFAKELVATAASTAGQHIQNGGSIAGISKDTGDFMTDIMVEAIAEVFVETTTQNLSDTTATLFGVDLNQIEEEKKTEKEIAKESKEAEKQAAKESKEAEKQAAKESKEAEKQAAKESKEAEKESKKAEKDKTTAPETTKTPVETTVAPVETTTAPKETTSEPKETTSEPKETTSEPKETTSEPKETTSEPKETTSEPKETTKAPEETINPEEEKEIAQRGAVQLLLGINFNNAAGIFEDEAQCKILIEAVYLISENPTFKSVIKVLGELGGYILKDYGDLLLPHLNDEVVDHLYETLQSCLAEEAFYTEMRSVKAMVPAVKSSLLWIASEGNISFTDAQAELGAICIVAKFFTPENIANPDGLSYSQFSSYLGY